VRLTVLKKKYQKSFVDLKIINTFALANQKCKMTEKFSEARKKKRSLKYNITTK